MGHNIEYNARRGRHSFFSLKEPAWHGLGQIVQDAVTSEQAIKLAGLDFTVEKREVFTKPNPNNDLHLLEVPNTFCLLRTDLNVILNKGGRTVTSAYEVVQNVEAFEFFDNIVGSKQAIFETAGALGNGERIFVTAKLPSNFRILGSNDIIENYLLFTSSHDGSSAVEVMFTPIRVVCNNTLTLALSRNVNKISMRHTSNVKDKLAQAARLMGLYKIYDTEFQELISKLAREQMTELEVTDKVGKLIFTDGEQELWRKAEYRLENVAEISVRKRNQFDTMYDSIESAVGQDSFRGSKLWFINGVSSFLNNVKEYKGQDQKFEYVMYGGGQQLLNKALNIVMQ